MAYDIEIKKETPNLKDVKVADLPCLGKNKITGNISQLIGVNGNQFITHSRRSSAVCGDSSKGVRLLSNYTLAPPNTSITITQP